jgi:acyl dehydratase
MALFPRLLHVIGNRSFLGPDIAVPQRHWEDFTPGSVFESEPRRVTREEIIEFAAAFDPQPMHLDEEAARASMLGSLAASGWHSCCLLMRMLSDGFLSETRFMGAPGIDEVSWLKPLRPGESIRARATVLESRPSRSRPDLGFVKFLFELVDSSGACLMTLTVSPMFARRTAVDAAREVQR